MSLNTIGVLVRCVEEIEEALEHESVVMSYSTASHLRGHIRALQKLVDELEQETTESRGKLVEIIEGLLANWPHTEIRAYYKPNAARAVLTGDEALMRAGELFKTL